MNFMLAVATRTKSIPITPQYVNSLNSIDDQTLFNEVYANTINEMKQLPENMNKADKKRRMDGLNTDSSIATLSQLVPTKSQHEYPQRTGKRKSTDS